MANKTLTLMSLGVLVLLTLLTFASAAVTINLTSTSTSLSQSSGSFVISVTDSVAENVNLTPIATTDVNGKVINFSLNPVSPLVNPSNTSVTVSYTVPSDYVFESGKTYSVTLSSTNVAGTNTANPLVINFVSTSEPADLTACKLTSAKITDSTIRDDLTISIDKTKVVKGFKGSEDTSWYPLDEIQIDILAENNGNEDMRNVEIAWALYDKTTGNIINHDKLNDFNLNSEKEKTVTIDFKLDEKVSKFKNNDEYVFYVWANADDKTTPDVTKICTSFSEPIEIVIESDFVILDNIQTSGTISCGSSVQVTATAWNIGDTDEDDVYVLVQSTDLGINQKVELGTIDSFDSVPISLDLTIPTNAQQGKPYDLQLTVYNQDGEPFTNTENKVSRTLVSLTPESGCTNEPQASITTALGSAAEAGKDIVIKATITNNAITTKTYAISADGFTNWASLVSLDKTSLTLTAGQSADVTITLKANSDVSGNQDINIVVTEGTKVLSKPFQVPVQKPVFGFTGAFLGGDSNWYIIGIGALNVILILVIIIVAVRVVKK